MRRALLVAALLDITCAVVALVPLRAAADWLGIPIGEPVMHIRFAGLLYAILPIFYLMGAASPRLTPSISAGAVLARAAGTTFMVLHLIAGAAAPAYWIFAALEALIGLVHLTALSRAGIPLTTALRGETARRE
jgi:hypothetical protein